jgi:glycosyltransferase involved in cell wall biosynthesis
VARVAISAEYIRPGLVGGTEQALHYLLDGIAMAMADDDRLVVVGHDVPVPRSNHVDLMAPPRRARSRFMQELLSYRAIAPSADSYYFPNYFMPPVRRRCRTVVTIPDLQYLHLPENFSRRKRAWMRLAHRHSLARADRVTVYSRFVRDDIADRYGVRCAGRVEVVPIPVSWDRFGEAEHAQAPSRPFVLAVSSHYRHKNLSTLLRAFAILRRSQPEFELVLVGQLGANLIGVRQAEDVPRLIAELGLADSVRATGFITPLELGQLYRSASLFAFPSIFEGFGLPPVEALGFGLPVITTRCASLPEVTRGLADYVDDPFDPDELAALMDVRITAGRRPTSDQVADLRAFYAPARIGRVMYDVLTGRS